MRAVIFVSMLLIFALGCESEFATRGAPPAEPGQPVPEEIPTGERPERSSEEVAREPGKQVSKEPLVQNQDQDQKPLWPEIPDPETPDEVQNQDTQKPRDTVAATEAEAEPLDPLIRQEYELFTMAHGANIFQFKLVEAAGPDAALNIALLPHQELVQVYRLKPACFHSPEPGGWIDSYRSTYVFGLVYWLPIATRAAFDLPFWFTYMETDPDGTRHLKVHTQYRIVVYEFDPAGVYRNGFSGVRELKDAAPTSEPMKRRHLKLKLVGPQLRVCPQQLNSVN